VLILDVMMPEISGYDLCYLVKSEERLKKIPVVFLTARGAPQDFQDWPGRGRRHLYGEAV